MHEAEISIQHTRPSEQRAGKARLAAVAGAVEWLYIGGIATAATPNYVVSPHGHVAGQGYGYYSPRAGRECSSRRRPGRPGGTLTVANHRVAIVGARVTGPGSYTQTCAEPAGRAIYVKVLSNECSTFKGDHAGSGTSPAELDKCAGAPMKDSTVSATLDGQRIAHFRRWAASSGVYSISLHQNNFHRYTQLHGRSAAYGYGLLLHGLPSGTHTLDVSGDIPAANFRFQIAYTITVR
jgi:hypothetical protein